MSDRLPTYTPYTGLKWQCGNNTGSPRSGEVNTEPEHLTFWQGGRRRAT